MSTKRATSVLLLTVAIIAAVLLVNQIGLFKRPSPSVDNSQGPSGDQMQTGTSVNPTVVTVGPGQPPPVSAIPQSEIDQALRDWTCPGAVSPKDKAWAQAAAQKPKENTYTKLLEYYGPPAKVWRFYQKKANADPGPTNPASQLDGPMQGGHIPFTTGWSMSAQGTSMAMYYRNMKDYRVAATLTCQAQIPGRTQIILMITPRSVQETAAFKALSSAPRTSPLAQ